MHTDTTPALKGSSASGLSKGLVRRSLIVVQISMAVVLLFGASLFSRSLRKLKTVDLGYDIEHVTTVSLDFHGKEPFTGSPALHGLLTRVRQLPGIESADLALPSVLSGSSLTSGVESRDGRSAGARKIDNCFFLFASPQHFSTLRMPLLRGRDFSDQDRKGSPGVAIVNQFVASTLWPGQDAIGKHLNGWGRETLEVIGVVGNSKYQSVRESVHPIVYVALDQMPIMGATLEMRSQLPSAQPERQIRQLVRSTAPNFEVANVSTMEMLRDHVIAQDRLLTFLSVLFGALGAVLALVGIYGLISYSVTRRSREIGIRMSAGAQRGEVLLLFLREAMVLLSLGVVLGLPLALLLSKPLKTFLYEIPRADPLGIAVTLLTIAIGSLTASFLPAWRGSRIDPVEALRYE